jgi:hypothetical protein
VTRAQFTHIRIYVYYIRIYAHAFTNMAGSCQLHHRQTGRDALSFVNNQTNTNKPPPTRRTH